MRWLRMLTLLAEFGSQNSHGCLQPLITPVSEDLASSSGLLHHRAYKHFTFETEKYNLSCFIQACSWCEIL